MPAIRSERLDILNDIQSAPGGGPAAAPGVRYTIDVFSTGMHPPGGYDLTALLGPGTYYSEVRFNGYQAASQPLNIVIDGRQNEGAFRIDWFGVSSTIASMIVYGHAGTDYQTMGLLHGGLGDDFYSGNGVELAGEGTDTVYSRQGNITLADNIENLIYGSYSLSTGAFISPTFSPSYSATAIGRGNVGNNRIEGFGSAFGFAGDDTLVGGAGADTLAGGAGNDRLEGGAGLDTASYADAAGGVFVTLDAAQPTASNDGDGGADTLIGIENLTGSAFNDVLIGDAAVNVLRGGTGADVLIGLAGNDVLEGGDGAPNTLQGGLGDDLYRVWAVGDTVYELAGQGSDTVETMLVVYTLRDNLENLTYTGVGVFSGTGNAAANILTGGPAADTLNGGAGDDTLNGRVGDDLLRGGAGVDRLDGGELIDTVDYSYAAAGVTASLGGGTGYASNDGDGGTDVLLNIENLIGSAFNDVLIGTTNSGAYSYLDNVLSGGEGADVLLGLAGNDTLVGGAGAANQMQGGIGDDRYVVSVAGDTLIENAGEGTDTVATWLAAYTLRNNFENLVYTGGGSFTGTGNAANNTLTGGAGKDTFNGKGGDDTINGGSGVDMVVMSGVRADYTIQAGAGYVTIGDSIVGRDGIDTLVGIEQIRFSDGAILDLTPPAAAAVEALLPPDTHAPKGDADLPMVMWLPWDEY